MESITWPLRTLAAIIIFVTSMKNWSFCVGMEVYTSPDLIPGAHATIRISGNATLNPTSVAALSEILHTLESIKALRMNELEQLKLKENKTKNASVSDYVSSIDRDMDSMQPIRKTYGYKVTVYKQPFGADKPIVYKQDIEVDDHDVVIPNIYADDLQYAESQKNEKKLPKTQLKHSSRQRKGSSGFNSGQRARQKTVKEHQREKHSRKKSNKFHKVTDIVENKDVNEREREVGTEHAVKEKTEIEYYEKEKFIDTELPKAPSNYRVVSATDGYISGKMLHGQGSYPQPTYQMPSTDRSFLATVPYVHASSGTLPKSPTPTYHYHHHYDTGEQHHHHHHVSKDKGMRHNHHNHHYPPPRHYYTTQELDSGHIWEGFRERGYKITSQREYVVKDRIRKKEYGEKEAAVKRFKTSHNYKKSEKDEEEQNYYKKLKDSFAHASGFSKHQGRGQFGKSNEFLHGSANRNHESVANGTNQKAEFGHRLKSPSDSLLNSSSPTGQPSIAEIIKISIQEAVNRSRNKDRYGSYETAPDSAHRERPFTKPSSNVTINNTFYQSDNRPYISEARSRGRSVANYEKSKAKRRQRPPTTRSRRVDSTSLFVDHAQSLAEESTIRTDHSTLPQQDVNRDVESSQGHFTPSIDYPSSTNPSPLHLPRRKPESSDAPVLIRDETPKIRLE